MCKLACPQPLEDLDIEEGVKLDFYMKGNIPSVPLHLTYRVNICE